MNIRFENSGLYANTSIHGPPGTAAQQGLVRGLQGLARGLLQGHATVLQELVQGQVQVPGPLQGHATALQELVQFQERGPLQGHAIAPMGQGPEVGPQGRAAPLQGGPRGGKRQGLAQCLGGPLACRRQGLALPVLAQPRACRRQGRPRAVAVGWGSPTGGPC